MIVSMLGGMLHTISRVSQDPARCDSGRTQQQALRARATEASSPAWRCASIPRENGCTSQRGSSAPLAQRAPKSEFAGSLPLSIAASAVPEQITLEMQPGDCLTLITDGRGRGPRCAGVLFGFDRTQVLLLQKAAPLVLAGAAIDHGQDDDSDRDLHPPHSLSGRFLSNEPWLRGHALRPLQAKPNRVAREPADEKGEIVIQLRDPAPRPFDRHPPLVHNGKKSVGCRLAQPLARLQPAQIRRSVKLVSRRGIGWRNRYSDCLPF